MTNVEKTLGQLSGFLKLIVTPLPNLAGISGETVSVNDTNMVFEIDVSKESISLQTNSTISPAGLIQRYSVDAFLRGQSEQAERIFDFLIKYRLMITLMDQDGKYIRIGDTVNGLAFEFDYSPSPDQSGENGYRLSFAGDTLMRSRPVIFPFSVQ